MDRNTAYGSLAHQLIPLNLAAKAIYDRVYAAERKSDELWNTRLNEIAHTLGAQTPLYRYDPQCPGAIERLRREDILRGQFVDQAKVFLYGDGREAVPNLAITRMALEHVLKLVDAEGRPQRPTTASLIQGAVLLKARYRELSQRAGEIRRSAHQATVRAERLRSASRALRSTQLARRGAADPIPARQES